MLVERGGVWGEGRGGGRGESCIGEDEGVRARQREKAATADFWDSVCSEVAAGDGLHARRALTSAQPRNSSVNRRVPLDVPIS